MIIVGAKGFAKEILQIISVELNIEDIVFFDNVSKDLPNKLFNHFRILKSFDEVKKYLSISADKSFVLGLGSPKLREKLLNEFVNIGAIPKTVYAKNSEVGSFDVSISERTSILAGATISNSVSIGKGCLVYYNSVITHDCILGDFVEVSPSSTILGRCEIGDFTSIGAASVILPDVKIGKNVIIGAGTVVLNDVPDNSTIVGVPGKILNK